MASNELPLLRKKKIGGCIGGMCVPVRVYLYVYV